MSRFAPVAVAATLLLALLLCVACAVFVFLTWSVPIGDSLIYPETTLLFTASDVSFAVVGG